MPRRPHPPFEPAALEAAEARRTGGLVAVRVYVPGGPLVVVAPAAVVDRAAAAAGRAVAEAAAGPPASPGGPR